MDEKKIIPTRINFRLKNNIIPEISLRALETTIDLNSAKRLFNAEDKFNSITENRSESFSEERFSEERFSEMYETLDDSEKKLYRIWYLEIDNGQDISKTLEDLNNNSNIEFAEVDELNSLYYTPNDPLYQQMYGLKLIESECAWKVSQGEDIVIAVLDTGVNYNHPDIKDNMWRDTNGNHGYDFSDNDCNPIDYHGHGSHCAGTIAAVGNNNIGVIGVAPKAKIMAVKIFPDAYDSNIAKALKYAVDNGAKILSNSWGPKNRRESATVLEDAVDYVYSKGGICVFAAGNSNDDTKYYSPANMTKTITVGASDSNDKRASFSNYGKSVDLAAPGVNILSLRHSNSGYRTMSGTSMACPHIAGAIALLLKKEPHLNFKQVRTKIKANADTIITDKPIGNVRVNACKLLKK